MPRRGALFATVLIASIYSPLVLWNNHIRTALRSFSVHIAKPTSPHHLSNHRGDHGHELQTILNRQIQQQKDFQSLLRKQQNPPACSRARILWLDTQEKQLDGFALEIQAKGRLLMAAMASERTLVIRDSTYKSAYTPPNCTAENEYDCLHEPLSTCNEFNIQVNQTNHARIKASGKGSLGIIDDAGDSRYFSSQLYGPSRLVTVNSYLEFYNGQKDIVPYWERTMGRFWVRGQLAHYLWRPSAALQEEMEARIPNELKTPRVQSTGKFIGWHVRFTDNAPDFAKDFHRNASITRRFDHFLALSEDIRSKTNISTVFLASDSKQVLQQLNQRLPQLQKDGWTFLVQQNVVRSDSTERMWFSNLRSSAAAAIGTDVECLRRADYLIGSFQSNVYRLAVGLNTAYHAGNYSWSEERHFAVDIEWYEDP